VSISKIQIIFATIIAVLLAELHFILIHYTSWLPSSDPLFTWQQWHIDVNTLLILGITWTGTWLFCRTKQVYNQILLAMITGALLGALFGPVVTGWISPLGTIFIRLLKMIIVPLVFASLILGILSLGDVKKIGRIGVKTITYFIVTTMLAILIGLLLANMICPGKYIATEEREKYEKMYQDQVKKSTQPVEFNLSKMLINTVPTNPLDAMVKSDMLAIIFFAMFFGIALTTIAPEKQAILTKAFEGINDTMIQMVLWIMKIAPIGVFCLMADTSSQTGLSFLNALLVYILVVLTGYALQVVVVYGSFLRILAKVGLWEFLRKVWAVEMVAFSTSSSSATLPLTLRCADEEFHIPKEIGGFVISLGATINMNGTALYLGVATLFIAQVFQVPLDWSQQAAILIVATVSAIGTPGIPGGSIVFLSLILEMVHIPALGIALVFGVDRILDMFRTTINVMGDVTAALVVRASEEKRNKAMQ